MSPLSLVVAVAVAAEGVAPASTAYCPAITLATALSLRLIDAVTATRWVM